MTDADRATLCALQADADRAGAWLGMVETTEQAQPALAALNRANAAMMTFLAGLGFQSAR